jgi:PhnB protein
MRLDWGGLKYAHKEPSMHLNAYLNYGGNCAEAFQFYEKNLGGKITFMMRYADQPDPKNAPPGTENFILYADMSIGGTQLMGSDVPPGRFEPMRSVYLSLAVDSIGEAERIYALLSDGGEVFMAMAETFFAFRFGMLRDRFGTSWMILNPKPMPN